MAVFSFESKCGEYALSSVKNMIQPEPSPLPRRRRPPKKKILAPSAAMLRILMLGHTLMRQCSRHRSAPERAWFSHHAQQLGIAGSGFARALCRFFPGKKRSCAPARPPAPVLGTGMRQRHAKTRLAGHSRLAEGDSDAYCHNSRDNEACRLSADAGRALSAQGAFSTDEAPLEVFSVDGWRSFVHNVRTIRFLFPVVSDFKGPHFTHDYMEVETA